MKTLLNDTKFFSILIVNIVEELSIPENKKDRKNSGRRSVNRWKTDAKSFFFSLSKIHPSVS
jgi:hypothetical protein